MIRNEELDGSYESYYNASVAPRVSSNPRYHRAIFRGDVAPARSARTTTRSRTERRLTRRRATGRRRPIRLSRSIVSRR